MTYQRFRRKVVTALELSRIFKEHAERRRWDVNLIVAVGAGRVTKKRRADVTKVTEASQFKNRSRPRGLALYPQPRWASFV